MSTKETTNTTPELTDEQRIKKEYFEHELKRVDRNNGIKKVKFTMKEKQKFVENLIKFNESNAKEQIRSNKVVKSTKKKVQKMTKKEQLDRIMRIKKSIANNKNIPEKFMGSVEAFKRKLDKTEIKLKHAVAIERLKEKQSAEKTV